MESELAITLLCRKKYTSHLLLLLLLLSAVSKTSVQSNMGYGAGQDGVRWGSKMI